MTKEQFFTFKSDMKAGMRIIKLAKSHTKAYWNDGFETQDAQDEAIKRMNEEIKSLKESIVNRIPIKTWDQNLRKYVETGKTMGKVLGNYPAEHWAYYCAKHRLDENQSIEYVKTQLDHLKEQTRETLYWHMTPESAYVKKVKPILDEYETIVCVK